MAVTPDDSVLLRRYGIGLLIHILSFTIITLLYGVFISLFCIVTRTILRRGLNSTSKRAMFIIILISFLLNTIYWASWIPCFVVDISSKFVDNIDMPLIERFGLGKNVLYSLEVVQFLCFYFPIILSDIVVNWRAWVILSEQRRLMIAPLFLLFGTIVIVLASFSLDVMYSSPDHQSDSSKRRKVTVTIISFIAVSMASNLLATLLIAYKLWTHRKFISDLGLTKQHSRVQNVLILLVESGVIYFVVQLIELVLLFSKIDLLPNSQGLAVDYTVAMFDSIYIELSAMYPTIVVLIVNKERSMVDTYCLNTTLPASGKSNTEGHLPDIEHRPATVGHLSFAMRSSETQGTTEVEPTPNSQSIIDEGLKYGQPEK